MLIILDPNLFEIGKKASTLEQLEHYEQLRRTIDFVEKYFDAQIDRYDGAPYAFCSQTGEPAPITDSHYLKVNYASIKKSIMNMQKNGKLIRFSTPDISSSDIQFAKDSVLNQPFHKYLAVTLFQNDSLNEVVFISGSRNKHLRSKIKISFKGSDKLMNVLYDPAVNCENRIVQYISNTPTGTAEFPKASLCTELDKAFLREKKERQMHQEDEISLYKKYGLETSYRNGYINSPVLSRKNPNYTVSILGKYIISLDIEHGGLELFKINGAKAKHKGEYDFSCVLKKNAEPCTHTIKV